MSRSRKDSDSDNSGWGGFAAALGLGVAAVAGAVYIGKTVYDEVKEQQAKEEKLSYCDSKEEGACGYNDTHTQTAAKKVADDDTTSYSSYRPTPQTKHSRGDETRCSLGSEPTAEASLHTVLKEYYDSYVDIPHHKMAKAQNVVDYVKHEVLTYLQTNSKLRVRGLVNAGSTTEGLKVINADEFDVEIHLALNSDVIKIEDDESVPDYVILKLVKEYPDYDKFKTMTSTENPEAYLDPQKVRSYFQGEILEAVNSIDRYQIRPSTHGAAITLNVQTEGNSLDIDFVPVVLVGSHQLVAKPHPKFLKSSLKEFAKYWRWSFSHEERRILNSLPENRCHKQVLKIMKAIRENNRSQFGMFRSFTFKTVLMHMIDNTFPEEWEEDQLPERFIDFVKCFEEYLVHKNLPHYFVRDLNLFDELQPVALENAKSFLQKRVSRGDWETLLKKNKPTDAN